MKKNCIVFLLIIIHLLSCKNNQLHDFYMPAEFEKHEAVWLGWKHNGDEYKDVSIKMINALKNHVQINMVTGCDSSEQSVKQILLDNDIDTSQINWYTFKNNTFWMRDHGAPFMIDNTGNLAIANFAYNSNGMPQYLEWRYRKNTKEYHKISNKFNNNKRGIIDSLMGISQNARIFNSNIVVEGGGIEVNGKGTIILAESVTLDRNPGVSKEIIESEFKRVMNISKVIWLKNGLADDPHKFRQITGKYFGYGVGGHTDEFVRFVNPTTILLAWVNEEEKNTHPINTINYERMSENFEILKKETDQDGNPFTIIKVPLPGPIYHPFIFNDNRQKLSDKKTPFSMSFKTLGSLYNIKEGDTLKFVAATSYLNYFVSNNVILMPTYIDQGSSAEKEEMVKNIFKKFLPDRELILINSMILNYSGGGMHCGTQQQPKRKR